MLHSVATAGYLNLGTSLKELGRVKEAFNVFRDGTKNIGLGVRDRMAHDNARMSSYIQLGNLYAEQGKLQRALSVYREALHELPTNNQRDTVYHHIGEIYARLEKWDDAEKYHRAALDLQPNHVAAHLSYGKTLAQNVSIFFICFIGSRI